MVPEITHPTQSTVVRFCEFLLAAHTGRLPLFLPLLVFMVMERIKDNVLACQLPIVKIIPVTVFTLLVAA